MLGKQNSLGVKHTQEWKDKMSERLKKNPIKFWKGKTHTQEYKDNMSKSLMGRKTPWLKGKPSWNKGKHWTEEQKSNMSKIKIAITPRGEKSPLWKGGISSDKAYWHRVDRNRRLSADGSHTKAEWETLKAQYNWTCPACGKREPEIKLTEDHIIPLSKGGSDNIENIQPLDRSCNSKKRTKTIKY